MPYHFGSRCSGLLGVSVRVAFGNERDSDRQKEGQQQDWAFAECAVQGCPSRFASGGNGLAQQTGREEHPEHKAGGGRMKSGSKEEGTGEAVIQEGHVANDDTGDVCRQNNKNACQNRKRNGIEPPSGELLERGGWEQQVPDVLPLLYMGAFHSHGVTIRNRKKNAVTVTIAAFWLVAVSVRWANLSSSISVGTVCSKVAFSEYALRQDTVRMAESNK